MKCETEEAKSTHTVYSCVWCHTTHGCITLLEDKAELWTGPMRPCSGHGLAEVPEDSKRPEVLYALANCLWFLQLQSLSFSGSLGFILG